jgi:uncharacterized BrkB/YihY/UPF0761 family membrane protein
MKRTIIDICLILVVYVAFGFCIYLAVNFNLPQQLEVLPKEGVDDAVFLEAFQYWSLVVMGISLLVTFCWYVVGSLGPKAHSTSHGTWVIIWLMGLLVVLAAGIVAWFFGPQASEKNYILGLYFCCGGAFFYYLATMLFSPVNIKYSVAGSKMIRRW